MHGAHESAKTRSRRGSRTSRRRRRPSSTCSWPAAPSQLELFDAKPEAEQAPRPDSAASRSPRASGSRSSRATRSCSARVRKFEKVGQCGMDICELLPHHETIADELCWLRGMKTDVFNHGPAKCFINTGSPQFGRPSMGAWAHLRHWAARATDLPGFVVLQSGPRGPRGGASLSARGFLPSVVSGRAVPPRPEPDSGPRTAAGITPKRAGRVRGRGERPEQAPARRNRRPGDRDAHRGLRDGVPDADERAGTDGPVARRRRRRWSCTGPSRASRASPTNCLLARRLVERGVRFVQLYHTDWDHHGGSASTWTKPLDKHLQGSRPAVRGAGQGPEAARAARRARS